MSETPAVVASDVAALLEPTALRPAYQPIVSLPDGSLVAYELLARWPGLGREATDAFGELEAAGSLAALDLACARVAVLESRDRGVGVPALFVNVEPTTLAGPLLGDLLDTLGGMSTEVFVEITERRLLEDPGRLLRGIRSARQAGFGIALDDVGSAPETLSMLALIAPDVVKLDLSLVQRWPDPKAARVVTAVLAYVERAGATVLAEGIEHARDEVQALALGATLGQGWRYGRPGARLQKPAGSEPPRRRGALPAPEPTPFAYCEGLQPRVGPKGLLLAISAHLENQGMALESPPVVLSAFQHAERFTPATRRRYAALARRCPLVGAFGVGLELPAGEGVRGDRLASSDPLVGEWCVVVLGDHYAGALLARDLGDDGPDAERRFQFAVTHDYERVLGAARSLLERMAIDPKARHP